MRTIAPSELIINNDGSVFHLHLKAEQVAQTIILVGDPARVDKVAAHFDSQECRVENREFVTVTGKYKNLRVSVISTGIGTDNIDIVVNELDALVNVDLQTRQEKIKKIKLTLLRLGTCGAIQKELQVGECVLSHYSIGFDVLLNYYKENEKVRETEMEQLFLSKVEWNQELPKPYIVAGSKRLIQLLKDQTTPGITVSAPGFYAPQGRYIRLKPTDENLNRKMEQFKYNGLKITNIEMEGSALAGLAKMLGHDAITLCCVIAQRVNKNTNTNYADFVDKMIKMSLEKLSNL